MQITLPRLLAIVFWMSVGVLLANQLPRSWGLVGHVVGFAIGFAGAVVLTWAIVVGRILVFMPYPICRQGRCSSMKEYSWPKGTVYGKTNSGEYRYRCKCGDQYIRDGRRFMAVGHDGAKLPYKKLVGFHKWADDV
jgi:hypothetical protein